MFRVLCAAFAVAASSAAPAFAHTGLEAGGFASGLLHPLGGPDHVLAMVAVGLWAAQGGGRLLWALPAAFVAAMLAGGVLGMAGIGLPLVEAGILASVIVLGAAVAAALRLKPASTLALVALFGLFHGHAHGTELPAGADAAFHALGFMLATGLLHAAGIAAGLGGARTLPALVRAGGAATAAAGVALALAPL